MTLKPCKLSLTSARRRAAGVTMLLLLVARGAPEGGAFAQIPGAGVARNATTRVAPNRTLPRISPPTLRSTFADEPTTDELIRARVFPQALLPAGREPSGPENARLARTLEHVLASATEDGRRQALRDFVVNDAASPWRASVVSHLASLYAREGYFSRAADMWNQAWEAARTADDERSRAVADQALAEWLQLSVNFGQVARVENRLAEIEGRTIRGPAAHKIREAREGLASLINDHDDAIFSGPEALKMLMSATPSAQSQRGLDAISAYKPSHLGTSISELTALARQAGMALKVVHQLPIGSAPVPSIVHLRSQHFSAVIARRDGGYVLRDSILGGEFWMSEAALADEASGYVLVPERTATSGWRSVDDQESRSVVGHCAPGGPSSDEPCGCGGGPPGMPTYALHPLGSIVIRDTPLAYTPARGPALRFELLYNHRVEPQPTTPEYGSMGSMWDFDWQGWVSDKPYYIFGEYHAATVRLRGESKEAYGSVGAGGTVHWRSRAVLKKLSDNPPRYERELPDGTVEIYDLPDRPPSAYGRRTFLTQVIDPQGQTLTFTYDSSFRLVALTDAAGQVSTLDYEDPARPLTITKVTDPFGRSATFSYDALGRLSAVTDVAGMTSRFVYGDEDFITSMTTPYGTTAFRRNQDVNSDRFVEATDPAGGTERVEWEFDVAEIPDALPTAEVPNGFSAWNTYMDHYNAFYWDKRAMALHRGDRTKAVLTNWLWVGDVPGGHGWSRTIPHSIKRPLESRVWFRYPNQGATSHHVVGLGSSPTMVARVLDDGTTQLTQMTYNAQGMVTSKTDPLGRTTTYSYAANGIDLLEVRQVTSGGTDLLATYSNYNAQHLPGTVTDAAGQSTTTTYNAAGQPLTVTNAKGETTTYVYDPGGSGELLSVTGSVSGATTTYTYDSFGRIRTVTEADGYSVTTDYDALDRVTKRTYPDGTFEQFTYERLDLVQERDRLGRVTRHFYDAVARRISTRDPLGRVIRQDWCGCGSLDALVDANGNRTSWERDAQGRVTREVRGDGTTDTHYTYDGIGRLKTVTDPKDQVTTHTYLADDSLSGTVYTNAQIATPSVSYTYDPAYARVATMVDGIGTTAYTYKAPGQLGAGQVASVDGPLIDDTITYAYDQLGRVTTRAINGAANTVIWTFDALGRVTTEVNVLGTFGYTYDGVTSRLATVTYPNGQTSAYNYLPTNQDHRLQTIHHKYPGGATLSKFDYTYDLMGNIQTWRQQADSNPAVLWRYGYDAADQLTAAVKESTDPTPTILKRYAYGYDPAGNRTFEQIDDQITLATHDKLNRLLQHIPGGPLTIAGTVNEAATVTIQGKPATVDASGNFRGTLPTTAGTNAFTIVATDASGNQTTRPFEVDVVGQSRTFVLDANGNLASDGVRTFEWDARNRVVAIVTGSVRTELEYDGLSRRARRTELNSGSLVSDVFYIWDRSVVLEDRSSSATLSATRYSLAWSNGGVPYFEAFDSVGSVTEVISTGGALTARRRYDPYGRLEIGSDTAGPDEFFTSHIRDSASNLLFGVYRAYDAETGRWISQDPIGLRGGPNQYAYVLSNPLKYSDPLGLYIQCLTTIRPEFVNRTNCPGKPGCVTPAFSVDTRVCRGNPCDGYGFSAYVNLRVLVQFADDWSKPSSDTPGASLLTHELLHVNDFVGWCEGLEGFKSEGFTTFTSCEAARKQFLSVVSDTFKRTISDTSTRDNK